MLHKNIKLFYEAYECLCLGGNDHMNVKVAVFGRHNVIECMKRDIHAKDHIEIFPFPFSHVNETNELVDKAFMCDVFLFTNELSYMLVKEKIKRKRVPTVVTPIDEYAILTSLYELKSKKESAFKKLSIDCAHKKYVEKLRNDLTMNEQTIYTYSYEEQNKVNVDDIIDFHRQLWHDGKINGVLTSNQDVAEQLKYENIPVHLIEIKQSDRIRAIEQAENMVKLNKQTTHQVIVGHIQIKGAHTGKTAPTTIIQNVHDMLLMFGEQTNTSILLHSNDNFTIFGTRDLLNYIRSNFRTFPLLEKIKDMLPEHIIVHIGFGFGLTVKEAENNAHLSIEKCRENSDHCCYAVNERREILGPIGVKKEFNTSGLYEALIHKARLNNHLSYNFIQFITQRNNEPFSSNDIAHYYKVTKRSAERTINKLLSSDIIKHVGEERPYFKGRPRKLFQLNQKQIS